MAPQYPLPHAIGYPLRGVRCGREKALLHTSGGVTAGHTFCPLAAAMRGMASELRALQQPGLEY
eukprot:scaffold16545_cov121-Isochrysis_galbana.AAC.7